MPSLLKRLRRLPVKKELDNIWEFINRELFPWIEEVTGIIEDGGPSGDTGATGATGPDGADGIPGATGATGAAGTSGAMGPAGEDGLPGDMGPPGATGASGSAGAQGQPGVDGDTGPSGDMGPPGATGATGATGQQGPPGNDGLDGVNGTDGLPGPSGTNGANGATGPQGFPGNDGADGADGVPGPIGATGPMGLSGPVGSAGEDGAEGVMGPPGANGANGAIGLQGPLGGDGADGLPGDMGPPGGFAIGDGIRGVISILSGGTIWTVIAAAITNAMLALMGDATVKGRAIGAGTGAPQDLTGAQVGALSRWTGLETFSIAGGATYTLTLAATTTHAYINITGAGDVVIDEIVHGSSNSGARIIIAKNTGTGLVILRPNAAKGANQLTLISGRDWYIEGTLAATEVNHNGFSWCLATLQVISAARANSGGTVYTRRRLNYINGTGISFTIGEDATDQEIDVTAAASITPAALAAVASDIGVPFTVRLSFSATGAAGTDVDAATWTAPFGVRFLGAELRLSTATPGTGAAIRTAAAGAGSVVLPDATITTQTFTIAGTGRTEDGATATATLASAASIFLRIDRSFAGELILTSVRT